MKIENMAAYENRTDAILSWCPDWITSDEFDANCRSFDRPLQRGMVWAVGFSPDDLVLPSVMGNRSPNGGWIYLVQKMVDKGYVERRNEGGVVSYRAARFGE